MGLADLGTSIHGLTGQFTAVDEVMRLLAESLIYGTVVILAIAWFHRDGLRSGIAFARGALLALGIGANWARSGWNSDPSSPITSLP